LNPSMLLLLDFLVLYFPGIIGTYVDMLDLIFDTLS